MLISSLGPKVVEVGGGYLFSQLTLSDEKHLANKKRLWLWIYTCPYLFIKAMVMLIAALS